MKRTLPMFAVGLAIAAAACGQSDSPAPAAAPASSVAAPPALVHASQADLAHDLADADRLGTWRDVQKRWQGQPVRWSVIRQRMLCRSADDCNVAAFPIQRPAKQGWMPLLSFAPGQYEAMAAACGDREQCELTIEGTLSELDASADLPTKLVLSNVRLAERVRTAAR